MMVKQDIDPVVMVKLVGQEVVVTKLVALVSAIQSHTQTHSLVRAFSISACARCAEALTELAGSE